MDVVHAMVDAAVGQQLTPMQRIRASFDHLAGLPLWLPWRSGPESRKLPCRCRGEAPSRWYERECLGTFDHAAWHAKRWAIAAGGGVGVMLGPLPEPMQAWRLAGLDLDLAVSPDGRVTSWAQEVVTALDTYVELSPSGTGLKLFFLVPSDYPHEHWSADRAILVPAPGIGQANHKLPEMAFWAGCRRWFAVTGKPLRWTP